ncbi:MAG TPA: precorrin-6A synthase (deacetylating) [Ancylobacter sp.]
MRKILVIGIGAGNPEHLTVQAIEAMNRAQVFFLLDKGADANELVALRETILKRFMRTDDYRLVRAQSPKRELPDAALGGYRAGVEAWHRARAELFAALIASALPEDGVGAILVWGDPALYDSTLRVLGAAQAAGGVTFATEVIPGISAVQALCAAHKIVLNTIGDPVIITTGRRLAQDYPKGNETVVVMLDDGTGLAALLAAGELERPLHIHWGAYLGTPDEMLVAGRLDEVGPGILSARAEARARKGWVMDIYLVRGMGG